MEKPAELEPVEVFLEKIAFKKLKKLICESAGVNCEGYRSEYLKRRFEVRLRATQSPTYGKYFIYLKKNPEELQLLLSDLTINYTSFFRDFDVYFFLEKYLFPKLFESNPVRICSAGCATGEEPYSLAILVHKVLGETSAEHQVSILASDVDKEALAKAARGEYSKNQLRGISASLIEKYFAEEGELYRVRDFVRRIIRFEQRDLMKEPLHRSLDLILCRNVMIYFSKESQQQIHMNFYRALRDGGYLITGKAEMLSGEPSRKFAPVDVCTRVYQKPRQPVEIGQIGLLPQVEPSSLRL